MRYPEEIQDSRLDIYQGKEDLHKLKQYRSLLLSLDKQRKSLSFYQEERHHLA